jgi:hypothetical protein
MTFATTANITSVVETGGYFVHTVICTIIWESFPMSLVNDMKGELMSDLISRQVAISAICSACGKIDCDKMDKCEKLQLPPANNSEIPNSSDTISRSKAIEALVAETIYTEEELREYYEANSHRNEWVNGIYEAVEAIKQLPPAQPERIKGHWIKISPANIYECSECGKSVMTNDICAYDFCHGCGAEMEVTT